MACFLSTGLLCALASRLVSMFPLGGILNERHKATTLQRRYVHKTTASWGYSPTCRRLSVFALCLGVIAIP